MRASPQMPWVRLKIAAWPLHRARITSNVSSVAKLFKPQDVGAEYRAKNPTASMLTSVCGVFATEPLQLTRSTLHRCLERHGISCLHFAGDSTLNPRKPWRQSPWAGKTQAACRPPTLPSHAHLHPYRTASPCFQISNSPPSCTVPNLRPNPLCHLLATHDVGN